MRAMKALSLTLGNRSKAWELDRFWIWFPIAFFGWDGGKTMGASKFPDAPKVVILKQGIDGMPMAEICRRTAINSTTYFDWKL
jgi:hypothetical protein